HTNLLKRYPLVIKLDDNIHIVNRTASIKLAQTNICVNRKTRNLLSAAFPDEACDQYGIAMVFTGVRHFKH
ncbi:MAG: hypothetical protein LBD48_10955, partial [Treponema sp.]|nr:hypothetical protein [Treponema sp.]